MKTLKINTVLFLFMLFSGISYSQFDEIGQECGTDTEALGFSSYQNLPTKTPGNGDYLRALVIYVTFRNDVTTGYNYTIWAEPPTPTTATRPINPYSGTNGRLIDSLLGNPATNFMSRYSQYTISDYFSEMSMGAFEVIGDEYHFVTPFNEGYYDTLGYSRPQMNGYVLKYLDSTQSIDWSRYDNWEHTGSNWVFDPGSGDGNADLIVIVYRNLPLNNLCPDLNPGLSCVQENPQYGWFWDPSYGGEGSLFGNLNNTVLTFDGIDVGTHNGVTAINFRHNTTHSELIMIHEIGHKTLGPHFSHGMMTEVHDGSTYCLSPFERSYASLEYITPTSVTALGGNEQNFTLEDYIESGDALKISIPGTSDYFWVTNHQKNSIWDGTLRGGKNCYSTNFSEQDPFCGDGVGIVIEREGTGCSNMNESHDLVSAEGKYDWTVDRTVFVASQNYHHALGFNMSIPEEIFPGDIDTRYHGKDEYKKTVLSGVGTIVMNELCPTDYYISWENRGDQQDAFNMGYDEIFSPYSNPSTLMCNDEDDPELTIALVGEDHGEIDVRVYFDDEEALSDLPPSKPKNVNISKQYISSGYFNPKVTWDQNIEPDFHTGTDPTGYYKIYRGVTTVCGTEPTSYTYLGSVPSDVHEYIDEYYDLYENPGGSGICEYSFRALHYKISAVDITSLESLKSEKDVITGYIDPCAPEDRPMPDMGTPKKFALNQNYPNPFNPTTNIQYDIPNDVFVSIKVYDMLGREIAELVNEVKNAGRYIIGFNGSNLASGIYYYKIKAGSFEQTRRMVLIK